MCTVAAELTRKIISHVAPPYFILKGVSASISQEHAQISVVAVIVLTPMAKDPSFKKGLKGVDSRTIGRLMFPHKNDLLSIGAKSYKQEYGQI